MDTQPAAMADIETAIRSYLHAHPRAIDTERGIREWWLRDSRPQLRAADVQTAIERLVAAGAMAVHYLPGGERAYAASGPPTQVPEPRAPGQP